MTTGPLRILDDTQRFDCHACGRCCRNWEIRMSAEDHARLSAIDWTTIFPELAGKRLFAPAGEGSYRFVLQDDGACGFLAPDGRCRMHQHLGGEKKALVCRQFPFNFVPTPAGVFASLRYNCPSVRAADGRPLEAQRAELEPLAAEMTAGKSEGPRVVRFLFNHGLAWDQVLALEDRLLQILSQEDLDLTRRVRLILAQAHALKRATLRRPAGAEEVRVDVSEVFQEDGQALGLRPPLNFMDRLILRSLAARLHAKVDVARWSRSLSRRVAAWPMLTLRGLGFLLGLGRIRLDGFPRGATLGQCDRVRLGELTGERAAALTRFLRSRIAGQLYFGSAFHELPLYTGLQYLGVVYAAVLLAARASAAAHGRAEVWTQDIDAGLEAVELNVYSRAKVTRLELKSLYLALTITPTAHRLASFEGFDSLAAEASAIPAAAGRAPDQAQGP